MRLLDYSPVTKTKQQRPNRRPSAAGVAATVIGAISDTKKSHVYVASSEEAASLLAEEVGRLDPDLQAFFLPPWDCLPYDRLPPSRQAMGRRMDALREWSRSSLRSKLMITSIDALLQKIPPEDVIQNSYFELAVGEEFNKAAFSSFIDRTGYVQEGIVDDPGEVVIRDTVVDVFPAGTSTPMRIVLENGIVTELRAYDPSTQRTTKNLETMIFGPASEAIIANEHNCESERQSQISEQHLFKLYGTLISVFRLLEGSEFFFEDGFEEPLKNFLDIIEEARQARVHFDGYNGAASSSLYLDQKDWMSEVELVTRRDLNLADLRRLPAFREQEYWRKAVSEFVQAEMQANKIVILAGEGQAYHGFIRRLERLIGRSIEKIDVWKDADKAGPGSILTLQSDLGSGFSGQKLTLITWNDVVGRQGNTSSIETRLVEPEMRLGDVVVHEDHGIGILSGLETVSVEGLTCDAARLQYQNDASLLIPMQEFGKLWRYGSEQDAVTLDRLHTDAWLKRRSLIEKDIRTAARHLTRLAKERRDADAAVFAPPQARLADFARRFPFTETPHQATAIEAVLQDLASGTVMNRLICGDVGYGKTEIALRAAAAVTICGAQVVVIAPTTVLARQHYATFERRFAGLGMKVAMLSRVLNAKAAKAVKAGLANGDINIVVATQAILAKDIRFADLGLLIIDEEHRFGTRQKLAMKAMAPHLHTLTMSATPIPRTLQSAMIGIQDVTVLETAPTRRRPVRTFVNSIDPASIRVALMREYRRGGQSFIVVPQISDLEPVHQLLDRIVPELSIRTAHGKMKAIAMDETIVGFADGDGDVLVSTNIIENGLDVPRANTIFVWRADMFGLAQLHQLRGRVGRAKMQGMAYLLTGDGDATADKTHTRLQAMIAHDRLGAGLAISMQDLDLRGAGDIAGEDQAGHMKLIGVSLYQRLLERALRACARPSSPAISEPIVLRLGASGSIPADYVSEPAQRLNLYARLMQINTTRDVDELSEEFDDRFGDLPDDVEILLRLTRLRIKAGGFGIAQIEGGPIGLAIAFSKKPAQKEIKALTKTKPGKFRDGRLILEQVTSDAIERISALEAIFDAAEVSRD